MATEIS